MRKPIPREALPTHITCEKCYRSLPQEQFELYPTGTRRHVCNHCKYLHYSLPAYWRRCLKK